jgi:hypothetical protein
MPGELFPRRDLLLGSGDAAAPIVLPPPDPGAAPDPVVLSFTVPAPTISAVYHIAPSPVALTLSVPTPTIAESGQLLPTPVGLTFTVPTPSVTQTQHLTPSPVSLTLSVPVPDLSGTLYLTPPPVVLSLSVLAPTLSGLYTIAPSPVSLALTVPAPTIAGVLSLAPSPVGLTFAVPTPSIPNSLSNRIKDASPIGYWRLAETSGTQADDFSGNARHGTHTGVTLNQTGIGDGLGAPDYDGTGDWTDLYTAGFSGAFDKDLGSALIWSKVRSSSVWTDGTTRYMFLYGVTGGTNRVYIRKTNNNNELLLEWMGGGTRSTITTTSYNGTGWQAFVLTWNKSGNAFRAFAAGGTQIGTTQTMGGTWTGAVDSNVCRLGREGGGNAQYWDGTLAHAAVWNRVLSASEIADLTAV